MFDKNYYEIRRAKIGEKRNKQVQRLADAAVEFTDTARELTDEFNELAAREAESKKTEATHADMTATEKAVEDDKKKEKKA